MILALLGKHLLHLLITKCDLVYWVTLAFKGFEIAFDVGREKDLCDRH
jgi:hypothetical protein